MAVDTKKQYPTEVLMWLIEVIQMPSLYYGRIPLSDLYKIFENGAEQYPGRDGAPGVGDITEPEFEDMVRSYLAMGNKPGIAGTPGAAAFGLNARVQGKEIVCDNMSSADLRSLRNEKKRFPMDHKILSFEEVNQILEKGYLTTPESDAFEQFLIKNERFDKNKAIELTRHIAIGFMCGDNPQDGLNELLQVLQQGSGSTAKAFSSGSKPIIQTALNQVADIFIKFYNNVGQMGRYGWSPDEIAKQHYGKKIDPVELDENGLPKGPLPNGATLVPASSEMAKRMKDNEELLKQRGVKYDLKAAASRYSDKTSTPEGTMQRGRAKLIYPNDPCPCGSGLAYKDCHGRK